MKRWLLLLALALVVAGCAGREEKMRLADLGGTRSAAAGFLMTRDEVRAITGPINGYTMKAGTDMESGVPILRDITSRASKAACEYQFVIDGAKDDAHCNVRMDRRNGVWRITDWDAKSHEALVASAFYPEASDLFDGLDRMLLDRVLEDPGLSEKVGGIETVSVYIHPVIGFSREDLEGAKTIPLKGYVGHSRFLKVKGDKAEAVVAVNMFRRGSDEEWTFSEIVDASEMNPDCSFDPRIPPRIQTIYTKTP